ncbi:hypothetical protein SUGI_0390940 [Cryptomeria japonica]|nr:hypothetical protein SUGI_0390940 [Cryptomeria japonica]
MSGSDSACEAADRAKAFGQEKSYQAQQHAQGVKESAEEKASQFSLQSEEKAGGTPEMAGEKVKGVMQGATETGYVYLWF